MLVPTPTPSGGLRRGITTPFLANNAPYRSGLRLVCRPVHVSPIIMRLIPPLIDSYPLWRGPCLLGNAYPAPMPVSLLWESCIYARSFSSRLDSSSKSSRRVLRTDSDFDCPGADPPLFPREPSKYPLSSPPGVGLSVKAESSSPYSSSNLSDDCDLCQHPLPA